MHLRSSKGPINVLVLNQDEDLASLVPNTTADSNQSQGQPLTTADDSSTRTTLPSTSHPSISSSTTTTGSSTSLLASIAGPTSSVTALGGSVARPVGSVAEPQSIAGPTTVAGVRVPTGGGVVTRRMRRQAAGESQGGEGKGRKGERERGVEESGSVSGAAAVKVSIDEVEDMDTKEVHCTVVLCLKARQYSQC